MKLKLDAQGHVVVNGGNPVYLHADGREEAFDAAGTMTALTRNLFGSSEFVAKKLSIPADVARSAFSSAFKVENGKVVAYDSDGNKLYSRSRFGEEANFNEAIEQLVDRYPQKAMIVRTDAGKAAATPTEAKASAAGRTVIKRAEFDALDHGARMTFAVGGGRVVD